MKQTACLVFFVLLALLLAGCSQPAATAATPAPTPSPTSSPMPSLNASTVNVTSATPAARPTATATAVAVQKQIDVTATQDGSDIVVRYRGGVNATDLMALVIKIDSFNGQSVTEREDNPVVGQEFPFSAVGMADSDLVTITGIFRDGTGQVVFQKKI